MKNFKQYLTESVKEYSYRIKFAGLDKDADMNHLEKALEKYSVSSMSKPKVTPIQQHPMDFQNLDNLDVTIVDLVTAYPASLNELRLYVAHHMGLPEGNVLVFSGDHQEEIEREEAATQKEKPYKSLLTSPYEKVKKEDLYGTKYNEKLVKDEKKKSPKQTYAAKGDGKAETTNDLPQGKMSPVGSTVVKKPTAQSIRR